MAISFDRKFGKNKAKFIKKFGVDWNTELYSI